MAEDETRKFLINTIKNICVKNQCIFEAELLKFINSGADSSQYEELFQECHNVYNAAIIDDFDNTLNDGSEAYIRFKSYLVNPYIVGLPIGQLDLNTCAGTLYAVAYNAITDKNALPFDIQNMDRMENSLIRETVHKVSKNYKAISRTEEKPQRKSSRLLRFYAVLMTAVAIWLFNNNSKNLNFYNEQVTKYNESYGALSKELVETKNKIKTLNENIELLRKERDRLTSERVLTKSELSFYQKNAVFVTSDAGTKFHLSGCPHIQGKGVYIYNIELAKGRGYTACADCYKPRFGNGD